MKNVLNNNFFLTFVWVEIESRQFHHKNLIKGILLHTQDMSNRQHINLVTDINALK